MCETTHSQPTGIGPQNSRLAATSPGAGSVSVNSTLPVLWIVVSNFFLTVLTIGLFRPFAVVRMARYRAESMALVPGESLDHFVGMQSREVEAMGEEVTEFFDIDIAL